MNDYREIILCILFISFLEALIIVILFQFFSKHNNRWRALMGWLIACFVGSPEENKCQKKSDTRLCNHIASNGAKFSAYPLYSCTNCQNPLAFHSDLLSKGFKAKAGQEAYMFSHVMNIVLGPKEDTMMLSGIYTKSSIFCSQCRQELGWMYVRAFDPKQSHKEGKFIVERLKLSMEKLELSNKKLDLSEEQKKILFEKYLKFSREKLGLPKLELSEEQKKNLVEKYLKFSEEKLRLSKKKCPLEKA